MQTRYVGGDSTDWSMVVNERTDRAYLPPARHRGHLERYRFHLASRFFVRWILQSVSLVGKLRRVIRHNFGRQEKQFVNRLEFTS